jgi:hypothetical protein
VATMSEEGSRVILIIIIIHKYLHSIIDHIQHFGLFPMKIHRFEDIGAVR